MTERLNLLFAEQEEDIDPRTSCLWLFALFYDSYLGKIIFLLFVAGGQGLKPRVAPCILGKRYTSGAHAPAARRRVLTVLQATHF